MNGDQEDCQCPRCGRLHRGLKAGKPPMDAADPRQPGKSSNTQSTRQKVATLLWEKQFEGTAWATKIHLIAPRSLEPYREFADQLIAVVGNDLQ